MGERKGTKGLELWCRKMTEGYPGVKIDNMTTSWRDGLAFCAIIHHFRPDLIEFDKLNKDDIYRNNELAYRVAEHHLGIPALLEPEDMVEYEVPDRLSILTYLSQFYQAFENPRGKSAARIAPKRAQSSTDHGIVSPASTSPPSKVHITIGKARRDPCAKCGLPVFIAERLNVGKLLFHRTCFRCARCNCQLILANSYETENGEFCCEICPDEERQISKKVSPESVLTRSLSDEEKTASLQSYSNAPDAYSTHFETALEYPLDGELKKSFTLTGTESAEFTQAKYDFFNSQLEVSSESEGEVRPQSILNEPPKETSSDAAERHTPNSSFVNNNNSFPNNVQNNINLSYSDSGQTDDHFVTKENLSSSSRVSVRARMKLFEHNNEDNKSDVNKISSIESKVPLTKPKIKATVVSIDDLEDFDNISRKDDNVLEQSDKVHSNKMDHDLSNKPAEKEESVTNLELREDNFVVTTKIDLDLSDLNASVAQTEVEATASKHSTEGDDINFENPVNLQPTQQIKDEILDNTIITVDDSNSEKDESHITIDSEESEPINKHLDKLNVTIDSSEPSVNFNETYLTANNSILNTTDSSEGTDIAKRRYYTAYHLLPSEDEPSDKSDCFVKADSEIISDIDETSNNIFASSTNITQTRCNTSQQLFHSEDENVATNESSNKSDCFIIEDSKIDEAPISISASSTDDNPTILSENSDLIAPTPKTRPRKKLNSASQEENVRNVSATNTESGSNPFGEDDSDEKQIGRETDYPEALNPFDDDDSEENASVPNSEILKPTTVPRQKKKILPNLEDKQFTGTPEYLSRMYTERISLNPFEEKEEEEEDKQNDESKNNVVNDDKVSKPSTPPRQKKKIIPLENELPRKANSSFHYNPFDEDEENEEESQSPKSNCLNPFEDDEDEEQIEAFVKPSPLPVSRNSRLSQPDLNPRDTLSNASRGSHGGSTSSISSGSAFGSARKKKPAPRPPLPFGHQDSPSAPGSSLTFSSITQSPNLSGTIRSRKTKRAPLPPTASTPSNFEKKDVLENPSFSRGLSPIDPLHSEVISDNALKEKKLKNQENKSKQSQVQNDKHITDSNLPDKSTVGRWKRRKGQAPSKPVPQRRIVKTLPISEIKRELDTIEIQQQGLEKQGVKLEQIIREKCEGSESANTDAQVPIEVEDMILQLFELVNEKNELFRRQAELMYLRRQQRLEEEYADVEYQIRCLMLQPEANKSDSDKVREEILIQRLVEIVERRNEIIECLETDRKREVEEDNSISSQLNLYSAKRDGDKSLPKEEEKKDKKKKHKKLNKIIHPFKHKKEKDQKVDVDKDVDESELNSSTEKGKKKKFHLF